MLSGQETMPRRRSPPPQRHPPLTCADQLTDELLLHPDVDGQFPDLLLGLGQSPLRGHGSWVLAGLNRDLAATSCYDTQTVRVSTLTESGGGGGVEGLPGRGGKA